MCRSIRALLVLLPLLFVWSCSSDDDSGTNDGNGNGNGNGNTGAGRVKIECPVSVASPQTDLTVAVKVYITIDEAVKAFSLGFRYNSNDIEITDVIAGPALPEDANVQKLLDPANNRVLTGWLEFSPDALIQPQTDAEVLSLIVTIPAGTPMQNINIDTTFIPPAGYFLLTKEDGGEIYPSYVDCGSADIVIGTVSATSEE